MDFTAHLPDKILLLILSHLMELPRIVPLSAGEMDLTLLAVCRRWRNIIIHSPNEWTNVVMSRTASSSTFQADVKSNRCWFKVDVRRHSDGWIYLSLLHSDNEHLSAQNSDAANTSAGEVDILENIVFPAASRTKCLTLPLCSSRVAESFLTTPGGQFHQLESIEMCFIDCGQPQTLCSAPGPIVSNQTTVFQSSPFLRHLSLIANNGLNPLTITLPWNQFTAISMGFTTITPEVFIALLSMSSSSLSTAIFKIKFVPKISTRSSSSHTSHSQCAKIFAPALQHLHLRLINPSFDPDMLTRIRPSGLIAFRVDLYDPDAGWMLDIYHPLVCLSSQTLQQVEFWDLPLLPGSPHRNALSMQQSFEGFFSTLPMVRFLRLPVGVRIPEAAIDLIAEGRLLPLVEALEVASYTGIDILTMVGERNEVAYQCSGLVGSSSAAVNIHNTQRRSPAFFSEVVLWTPGRQIRRVNARIKSLQLLSSSQFTKFGIVYAEF